MVKPIRLSPSSLNLFLDCPRCFWLQVKKGIKRPQGPMASIAVGLDSVLKRYFERYRAASFLPPILADKMEGVTLAQGMPKTLYLNRFLDSQGVALMGRPDDYLKIKGDFFAPLDHKTRASSPKEIHPSYQLQLDTYTLLLEENNYPTQHLAYLAYYLPQEGELHEGFPFTVEVHEIETSPQKAEEVFKAALEVLNGPLPPPSPRCIFCNWHNTLKKEIK